MVLLRDLVLFTLFFPGAARRSIRLGGSHRDAQEQTNTRTEAFEASGDLREAFLPQGLTGRVHGRGPQAVASQPADGHVPSGLEEIQLPRQAGPSKPTRTSTITALAPSGVDGWPEAAQQAAFATTFLALGASAVSIDAAYRAAQRAKPGWPWAAWESGAALLLGAVFVTAGRSHFTVPEAFIAIYPPLGTWGFWYLPGSAAFHVAWTGVAEICGGSGLLLGGALDALALTRLDPAGAVSALAPSGKSALRPLAARALLLLVLAVTPANFLMFSHGATMPGIVEGPLSMPWHLARFAAQVSILSVFLTLAELRPREEQGGEAEKRV